MKKSAHEIWKQAIDKKLSDEEYKNLLKTEGIIIEKSKEEIRSMFMDKINVPKNIDQMFEKSKQYISSKWCNCENKYKGEKCLEHDE